MSPFPGPLALGAGVVSQAAPQSLVVGGRGSLSLLFSPKFSASPLPCQEGCLHWRSLPWTRVGDTSVVPRHHAGRVPADAGGRVLGVRRGAARTVPASRSALGEPDAQGGVFLLGLREHRYGTSPQAFKELTCCARIRGEMGDGVNERLKGME